MLSQTAARPDAAAHKVTGSTDTPPNQPAEDVAGSSQEEKHQSVTDVKRNDTSRRESPIRLFGSKENVSPTPFEPAVSPTVPSTQKSGSIFTYVNPFEQLAASSPRNTKSKVSANGDKRKKKSPSPAAIHASSRRKLTPSGSEVLQSIESSAAGQPKDDRSQIEALMGIGAPSRNAETVAEALNEVGDRVDRQVESALAKAEEGSEDKEPEIQIKQEPVEDESHGLTQDSDKVACDLVADVKKELDKPENQAAIQEIIPEAMAAAKTVVDGAANTKGADEWESAEGEAAAATDEVPRAIPVYQFPMRPFVSINIVQKKPAKVHMREESVMHVARFKKDFDQADRTLATATNEFIVYSMPKNGGIRIIQQDNGRNSLIFSKTQDRIFNVAISTSQSGSNSAKGTQTVLATGVSGTVYWTTIAKPGEELTDENLEKESLTIPPTSSQSDPTSSGQLKTRAKKSNRHPEFFAIGRGKSIQIIFATNAQSSELVTKEGLMDTEKYFAERNLKVTTGKAGKDFAFSEDDSTIASLDKAGKLRIWDIRELTNEANEANSLMTPIEVKTPILTFSTASSNEKSWPTSVMFVDKLRPYMKGTALRYIVVGMKQNHTLQLWDLCLGKAVQELSFPHESETDAICSVTYHPASGVIVVGHPTRNSIYFVHLSAPKYNLPAMPQAKFVQRLANKDSTLPKAEATAIMSGMREYSFADRGLIRSIELVPSSRSPEDDEDPTLFELYVLHSRGCTCLSIKKEDLGWSKETSKVLHPVDAEKEGLVIVRELRELSASATGEQSASSVPPSANGDAQAQNTPLRSKTQAKESAKSARAATESAKAAPAVVDRSEKKKNKRNGSSVVEPDVASQAAATPAPSTSESYASAAQRVSSPSLTSQSVSKAPQDTHVPSVLKSISRDASEAVSSASNEPSRPLANGDYINVGISGDFLDKELKKIEHGVSEEFNKVLGRELESLYRRFSEDKRVQDAAGAAKQDAMLRLVSSTLSDNVEKSLSRIIHTSIQDSVVPAITDVTSATLKTNMAKAFSQQLDEKLSLAIKQNLPEAVTRTMQSQQVLHSVSEHVTKAITGHVKQEFLTALHTTIAPEFSKLAVTLAQKISGDTERRVREQLQQAEIKHREDSAKIDQLTSLVRGLSETVHTMAAAQSDFQVEILKQQQKTAEGGRVLNRHSPTPSESASMAVSPEQEELDSISTAMHEGRFEDATVLVSHQFRICLCFDLLFLVASICSAGGAVR